METFEEKLREYRKRKQRELRYLKFQKYCQIFWPFGKTKKEEETPNETRDGNRWPDEKVRGLLQCIIIIIIVSFS